MNVPDALIEYAKKEIIPHVSGGSEFTAAVLNGILNASKKRISRKIGDSEILKSFGFVDSNGVADPQALIDFADGIFEGRDKVSVSMAELVKILTGVDSSSELLRNKLTFSRSDAETIINLLKE